MEPPDESRDPKQFRAEKEKSVEPGIVEPWPELIVGFESVGSGLSDPDGFILYGSQEISDSLFHPDLPRHRVIRAFFSSVLC